MITALYRVLFQRVRIRPAIWTDWRKPFEVYLGWELLYRAKLNRNLFERNHTATMIEFDSDYVPEFLREKLPSILKRQAA